MVYMFIVFYSLSGDSHRARLYCTTLANLDTRHIPGLCAGLPWRE
jgi:hypothetical protein